MYKLLLLVVEKLEKNRKYQLTWNTSNKLLLLVVEKLEKNRKYLLIF